MTSTTPISDIGELLKSMDPTLSPVRYAFATIEKTVVDQLNISPVLTFVEDEGVTLILRQEDAINAHIEHEFICQKITLSVHSALAAVGFMAAISEKLRQVGVPCNVVAGYHHDHLFIPVDKVEIAMTALNELAG